MGVGVGVGVDAGEGEDGDEVGVDTVDAGTSADRTRREERQDRIKLRCETKGRTGHGN